MQNSVWAHANIWLLAAATLSIIGAALHVAIIFGGPAWYRSFGAGEQMALAAARGSPMPALLTAAIAIVLLVWAAYALAAAGLMLRLPLMAVALIAITAVLTVRGGLIFVPNWWRQDLSADFKFWSSLFVLAMALCYGIGTWQRWDRL